jgi:hypothetical protein
MRAVPFDDELLMIFSPDLCLTAHSVNRIADVGLCLYLRFRAESFGIVH